MSDNDDNLARFDFEEGLEGIVAVSTCDGCGAPVRVDFRDYPANWIEPGFVFTFFMVCDACDADNERRGVTRVHRWQGEEL